MKMIKGSNDTRGREAGVKWKFQPLKKKITFQFKIHFKCLVCLSIIV